MCWNNNNIENTKGITWLRFKTMLNKFSFNFIITPSTFPLKFVIFACCYSRFEMMLKKVSSNFIITLRTPELKSQLLGVITQYQSTLFCNRNNPLTWIHFDDDIDCEKEDIKNVLLVMMKNAPLNEKQLTVVTT